jgi:hypothetical protein
MLTIGIDTYVTTDEAAAYIGQYYLSTDPKATAWTALQSTDQEVLLRRAARQIDLVAYPGQKTVRTQKQAWPRKVARGGHGWFVTIAPFMSFQVPQVDYSNVVFGDYPADYLQVVPDLIKAAQVEEALEYACPDLGTANLTARLSPEQSIKIGDTHIAYTTAMTPVNKLNTIIYSLQAQQYLKPFVGGGYRVV